MYCIRYGWDVNTDEQLIYDSFNYIARNIQEDIHIPEITAMFGPPEEGALLAIVQPGQIDEVMQDYLQFTGLIHTRLARLYPGIEEILRFTKERGKSLALFTGKGTHTTKITLQEFHIEQYFDLLLR